MNRLGGFRFSSQWAVAAGALVVALLGPLYIPTYWLHVVIIAYFFALLASSWSLLAGYAGQFSFAHMAFMAIGAYTSGILGKYWGLPPVVGIVAGTLVAGVAGLIIGALVLRFKPAYLALFTIAFSEILRTIIRGEADITRGDRGLHLEPLFGETVSKVPYYYTMLGLLVVSLVLMYWLASSRIGLYLRAIREDEEAAAARGVDGCVTRFWPLPSRACWPAWPAASSATTSPLSRRTSWSSHRWAWSLPWPSSAVWRASLQPLSVA